jgi:hypothetical protein
VSLTFANCQPLPVEIVCYAGGMANDKKKSFALLITAIAQLIMVLPDGRPLIG